MTKPATLPFRFSGHCLSPGLAWLVIVAAEMLTGTPGVGGFLWQGYNRLIYSHILLHAAQDEARRGGLPAQSRGSHRQGHRAGGAGWKRASGGGQRGGQGRSQSGFVRDGGDRRGGLEAAQVFFQYYRENANYLERTYDFVERLGIEKVRRETVYTVDEVRAGLLDRLAKAKGKSSDAWLERDNPRPTQFVQIQPMEAVR